MIPSVGTRIGPYELVSVLGAGGMGEVFRARDARLGRDVAIKVLPGAFRSDPDRVARFEREAQSLAALNHPNIAAIYGIEEEPGILALVLELVPGDTLAELIGRRPLLMPDGLDIALQIAGALEAAHERGIVHRDLKPANVKVTPAGIVKVLDFGLAKTTADSSPRTDLSRSPTMAAGATRPGQLVGTAAYMSPEQARGLPVDKRTDIWAFGCVLYEMLTRGAPFVGDGVAEVLLGVLRLTPDWTALPPDTPTIVRHLLGRCLEKDPKKRLRDIGDARLDIAEALEAAAGVASTGTAQVRPRREIEFQRLTDFVGMKESPAISPDGKMVAFVALVAGKRQIWIRLVSGGAPLQITRDDVDHEQPRWAPNSSTLIYYTRPKAPGGQGTIWEVSALGGPARRVTASIGGADISHDGEAIAVFRPAEGRIELLAVGRDGSQRAHLAWLPSQYLYSLPRWSPDDRAIAFQSSGIEFDTRLEIVVIESGERREVTRSTALRGFTWLSDGGRLAYSSSRWSTLLYPPVFNLRMIGVDGTGDAQVTFGDVSLWEPDFHPSGRLLACRFRGQSDVWRFPVEGSAAENTRGAARITRQTGHVQAPSVSPDGTEVVYLSDNGGHGNLWVARTDGSNVRQITFEHDPAVVLGVPMWSPANDWIVFIVTRDGQTGLWLVRPDGSDSRQLAERGFSACWSPDGRWVYYTKRDIGSGRHEKIPVEGGAPVVVSDETGAGTVGADEQTMYYAARVESQHLGRWSGDCEIRRVQLEDRATTVLGRIEGSRVPVSPLILQVFLSPDDQWLATPLADGATTNLWAIPTAGGPMRQLTDFGDRSILIARSLSWSADGRSLYAAVAETETDIVSFDGIVG